MHKIGEALCTFFEDKLPVLVGRVAADVLLDVRVLMVVDPHALVPRGGRQPPDQAGFPYRRLALDQHWVDAEHRKNHKFARDIPEYFNILQGIEMRRNNGVSKGV